MPKLGGSNVTLTIDGIPLMPFALESEKICAPVRLQNTSEPVFTAMSQFVWHLWVTPVISNYRHNIHVTWTKPTKRQLRKWRRVARNNQH